MRSGHHLLLSVAAGLPLALTLQTPLSPAGIVAYAAVLGTLIDLDHFPLSRYNTGDWRTLRRGLRDPRLLTVAQSELIAEGEVHPFQRLVSHLVIAGVAVGGLALADQWGLAQVTAVVLYVHLLADVAWEAWRRPLEG